MAKAHLVWSIESVLDYQSVFSVLGGITAVSGSQPQDLIHSPGLSLQPNTVVISAQKYWREKTCFTLWSLSVSLAAAEMAPSNDPWMVGG